MSQFTTIERSADIAAPPADVLALLVDLRRWVEWSPWEGMDPQLTRTYSGPDTGVGATYEWSGNRRAGAGRMTITEVSPSGVAIDLRFTRPFRSTSAVTFALAATAAGTHVVWRMRNPRTPVMRVFGLVMNPERMIGGDLEKGLASLAAVAAPRP